MATTDHTLVSDFLTVLKVPHTEAYTKQRFEAMPFKTLFGVTQLLKEYGVTTCGYTLQDKQELSKLKPPFIAQTKGGLVIVTRIEGQTVGYLTQGVTETMPIEEFSQAWTGVIVTAEVADGAREPDYGRHRAMALIGEGKRVLLIVLAALLIAYLYI